MLQVNFILFIDAMVCIMHYNWIYGSGELEFPNEVYLFFVKQTLVLVQLYYVGIIVNQPNHCGNPVGII